MNAFRRIYSFDYMGHKKWWFTISAVIIAAGLISMFVKGGGNPADGFNYGLEFKEGTRISVIFTQPATVAEVRGALADAGYARRADPGVREPRQHRQEGLPDPDLDACRRRSKARCRAPSTSSSRSLRAAGRWSSWAPPSGRR